MEKNLKNITFFELPESFEDGVIERIRRIKNKRKRVKIIILPAILIAVLSFTTLLLTDLPFKKEKTESMPLALVESLEPEPHADIYLEVIPVKDFEKESHYLIEFVKEKKEETIYAF